MGPPVIMGDPAPVKKKTFRKYSYRGVDLENLLVMPMQELMDLVHARARRRFKHGLAFERWNSDSDGVVTESQNLLSALRKIGDNIVEDGKNVENHLDNECIQKIRRKHTANSAS